MSDAPAWLITMWPAFVVSGVSESLSPRWNPEAGSQRARYTGELQVYVRAA